MMLDGLAGLRWILGSRTGTWPGGSTSCRDRGRVPDGIVGLLGRPQGCPQQPGFHFAADCRPRWIRRSSADRRAAVKARAGGVSRWGAHSQLRAPAMRRTGGGGADLVGVVLGHVVPRWSSAAPIPVHRRVGEHSPGPHALEAAELQRLQDARRTAQEGNRVPGGGESICGAPRGLCGDSGRSGRGPTTDRGPTQHECEGPTVGADLCLRESWGGLAVLSYPCAVLASTMGSRKGAGTWRRRTELCPVLC